MLFKWYLGLLLLALIACKTRPNTYFGDGDIHGVGTVYDVTLKFVPNEKIQQIVN